MALHISEKNDKYIKAHSRERSTDCSRLCAFGERDGQQRKHIPMRVFKQMIRLIKQKERLDKLPGDVKLTNYKEHTQQIVTFLDKYIPDIEQMDNTRLLLKAPPRRSNPWKNPTKLWPKS